MTITTEQIRTRCHALWGYGWQKELAKRIPMSEQAISNIMCGRTELSERTGNHIRLIIEGVENGI